jgi:diaminohydroxyphosphoribosylaminopyrimidine deaminase / 5-amino-6-(5-phosphoribosylamino)uracil reductase
LITDFDRFAMNRALVLAARGLETTHPNPRVGCVIAQGTKIVGEGWHARAGEDHAEVVALAAVRGAGVDTKGTIAYVTLEPCSHYGQTPPCTNALIEAGVSRVVYAVQDPNPEVSGQGEELLKQAGITVESGLMEAEAIDLNIGYMKRRTYGKPWVRLKLAMSLDGRTALSNGASQWITGEASRADVQHWRARSSAVLTGVGTVLADDPRLDVRLPPAENSEEEPWQPLRVVLDTKLRTPPDSRLFQTGGQVMLICEDASRGAPFAEMGVMVESLPATYGRIDLDAVIDRLGELEVNEVLVEAGPTLSGEMLRQGAVDEVLLYVAPKLLGPQGLPLVDLPPLGDLQDALGFTVAGVQRLEDDLRLRLRPR